MSGPARIRRAMWLAAWSVPAAIVVWSSRAAPPLPSSGSFVERLLGPFARVAAGIQWSRFDAALREGREELAYSRARSALALAPGDAAGWCFFARHLAYERGSPSREPDRAARERWIRAAFEVLDRGETAADDPGIVAFERGVIGISLARADEGDRAWPPTRDEAWRLAAEAFERAAARGVPVAEEAARAARAEIAK